MDNRRPGLKWPFERLDQITLALAVFLFLGSICILVAQLFLGDSFNLHTPSLFEIAASVIVVLVALVAFSIERERKPLASIAPILVPFLCLFWLPRIVALVPSGSRSALEMSITVLRISASGTLAMLLLRGVRLR